MIQIDEKKKLIVNTETGKEVALGSPEGFKILSDLWLKSGWETKHVYSFAWLGRPVIQLPEDMIRIQELIFDLQPDVIIETGIAHGGSLIYYASLCKIIGKGRIIGIDIEIKQHNRKAIEEHFLFNDYIQMVEGSSIDKDIVEQVRGMVKKGETVLVILDSNHLRDHVLAELNAYAPMLSVGSYIIATDGIMQDVIGLERTSPEWITDNPQEAARQFVKSNPDYVIDYPAFAFNEGTVTEPITYWPSSHIKRIK